MNFEQMKAIAPGLQQLEASAHNAGRRGSPQWLLWVHDCYQQIARLVRRVAHTKGIRPDGLHQIVRSALFSAWQRGAEEREAAPGA